MPWRQLVEHPQTYVQPHINQLGGGWRGYPLFAIELCCQHACYIMTVQEGYSTVINDLVVW